MSSILDESFSYWSREAQHDGRATGAPATATGTGCADVPSGSLSTLVVNRPGVEFRYRITPADLVWTARMIQGEAGGRKDADNYAVIWAMLNRFALLTNRKRLKKGYGTFSDFIRSYSTPLQPVLSYGSAVHHYDKPGYVRVGGAYPKNAQVPRGQLAKHLKLQKTCWSALSAGARAAALAVLTGQLGSPIGLATEFANTATYFFRKHKRQPTVEQWKAFNRRFGESKKVQRREKNARSRRLAMDRRSSQLVAVRGQHVLRSNAPGVWGSEPRSDRRATAGHGTAGSVSHFPGGDDLRADVGLSPGSELLGQCGEGLGSCEDGPPAIRLPDFVRQRMMGGKGLGRPAHVLEKPVIVDEHHTRT